MKKLKILCVTFQVLILTIVDGASELEGYLAEMRKAIAAAEREPTRENLIAMGEAAERTQVTGNRLTEDYAHAQKALLLQAIKIPGHAHVFFDLLEKRRETYQGADGSFSASNDHRRQDYLLQTVALYQSPEAVRLLGNSLNDFRDTIPYPFGKKNCVAPIPANAYIAACTLSIMELRDPPMEPLLAPGALIYGPIYDGILEGVFESVQEWWQQVESGEIPFSFVGQEVEYRFQPDGSVVSTPIEIPAAERERLQAEAAERIRASKTETTQPEEKQTSPPPPAPFPWPWVAAGAALLGITFGFIKLRK